MNEGASTSSGSLESESKELTDEERCDPDNYANLLVNLLIAEDVHGGDLRHMVV